jgi:hypothetical protein
MTQSNITRRAIVGGVAASVGLAMAAASGDIVGAARAQSAPRTFVLVHGTLVAGWCWRRLSDLLEKKGHKVFSPTLMGLGERSLLLSKGYSISTRASPTSSTSSDGRISMTFVWSSIPMAAG